MLKGMLAALHNIRSDGYLTYSVIGQLIWTCTTVGNDYVALVVIHSYTMLADGF